MGSNPRSPASTPTRFPGNTRLKRLSLSTSTSASNLPPLYDKDLPALAVLRTQTPVTTLVAENGDIDGAAENANGSVGPAHGQGGGAIELSASTISDSLHPTRVLDSATVKDRERYWASTMSGRESPVTRKEISFPYDGMPDSAAAPSPLWTPALPSARGDEQGQSAGASMADGGQTVRSRRSLSLLGNDGLSSGGGGVSERSAGEEGAGNDGSFAVSRSPLARRDPRKRMSLGYVASPSSSSFNHYNPDRSSASPSGLPYSPAANHHHPGSPFARQQSQTVPRTPTANGRSISYNSTGGATSAPGTPLTQYTTSFDRSDGAGGEVDALAAVRRTPPLSSSISSWGSGRSLAVSASKDGGEMNGDGEGSTARPSSVSTSMDRHMELLGLMAGKERRCLDLREELKREEAELAALKEEWHSIVSSSLAPSAGSQPSLNPSGDGGAIDSESSTSTATGGPISSSPSVTGGRPNPFEALASFVATSDGSKDVSSSGSGSGDWKQLLAARLPAGVGGQVGAFLEGLAQGARGGGPSEGAKAKEKGKEREGSVSSGAGGTLGAIGEEDEEGSPRVPRKDMDGPAAAGRSSVMTALAKVDTLVTVAGDDGTEESGPPVPPSPSPSPPPPSTPNPTTRRPKAEDKDLLRAFGLSDSPISSPETVVRALGTEDGEEEEKETLAEPKEETSGAGAAEAEAEETSGSIAQDRPASMISSTTEGSSRPTSFTSTASSTAPSDSTVPSPSTSPQQLQKQTRQESRTDAQAPQFAKALAANAGRDKETTPVKSTVPKHAKRRSLFDVLSPAPFATSFSFGSADATSNPVGRTSVDGAGPEASENTPPAKVVSSNFGLLSEMRKAGEDGWSNWSKRLASSETFKAGQKLLSKAEQRVIEAITVDVEETWNGTGSSSSAAARARQHHHQQQQQQQHVSGQSKPRTVDQRRSATSAGGYREPSSPSSLSANDGSLGVSLGGAGGRRTSSSSSTVGKMEAEGPEADTNQQQQRGRLAPSSALAPSSSSQAQRRSSSTHSSSASPSSARSRSPTEATMLAPGAPPGSARSTGSAKSPMTGWEWDESDAWKEEELKQIATARKKTGGKGLRSSWSGGNAGGGVGTGVDEVRKAAGPPGAVEGRRRSRAAVDKALGKESR